MTVRLFDWRDIPALHKYRNQGLFLDSTRLLTQGPKLVPFWALFSSLAAATGIFTYQSRNAGAGDKVLCQVAHSKGSAARVTFVAPASAIESSPLLTLLDYMTFEMGARGALHLIAEVDDLDNGYEALRKAGFGIYARQRIWRLQGNPLENERDGTWRRGRAHNLNDVRSLYCNLVPNLVQQVEPPPSRHLSGMIYCASGEPTGYAEVRSGPAGIWMQPFIHPDVEQVREHLRALIRQVPHRRARPLYICVRSYQSWLEPALEDLGAQAGPRQAVMVKHLAIAKKTAVSYALPTMKRGHPEVTASMTRRIVNHYDTTSNNR